MVISRHKVYIGGIIFLAINLLVGCSYHNVAPVDYAFYELDNKDHHVVQFKDTLYSIAWQYDWDYRELIKQNDLSPPYKVSVGQNLLVRKQIDDSKISQEVTIAQDENNKSAQSVKKVGVFKKSFDVPNKTTVKSTDKLAPIVNKPSVKKTNSPSSDSLQKLREKRNRLAKVNQKPAEKPIVINKWAWPTRGKVVKADSPNQRIRGIYIHGKSGSPIHATASGRIVYSGNGINGYGNLVIIKHNSEMLSAYAYNKKVMVQEGDQVKVGQLIAMMGEKSGKPMLHFELRKLGKPIDPLLYLPKHIS